MAWAQALDSTAVKDLLDASARTRPGFLDAAFLRNKRRAAQAGSASRQWYPTVDLWFLGTASAHGEGEAIENEVGCAGWTGVKRMGLLSVVGRFPRIIAT